jgi:hypothetical protein
MVTGDSNAPRFPQMAVRWLTPPKDIAVLVTAANQTKLDAELYHFGTEPRAMKAEFRQLKPGTYNVSQSDGRRATRLPNNWVITAGVPAVLPFTLPPRTKIYLALTLIE